MPTLKIQTNTEIPAAERTDLLKRISKAVAEMLEKPEKYVMIILDPPAAMTFGGDDAPVAYLELKSLGLPENCTGDYSKRLCDLMGENLGIAPERIYIEFAAPARHFFGWNGSTF